MLDYLPVSAGRSPRLARTLRGTLMSVGVHGLLIAAAARATITTPDASSAADSVDFDTVVVVIDGQPIDVPSPDIAIAPAPPVLTSALGLGELPPVDVPTGIRDAWTDRWATAPAARGGGADYQLGGPPRGAGGSPVAAVNAEAPPVLLTHPPLRYPPLLRDAGIEGTVIVEAVIDTTGHAEARSVRVVAATNVAFADAARSLVLAAVYRPGRLRGRRVRVLIRQPVVFRIGR